MAVYLNVVIRWQHYLLRPHINFCNHIITAVHTVQRPPRPTQFEKPVTTKNIRVPITSVTNVLLLVCSIKQGKNHANSGRINHANSELVITHPNRQLHVQI